MKNLIYLFLGLGITLILSCSEEETPAIDLCDDNHAEYYFNDTLFQTMHVPDGGEILTPSGTNCGIGVVVNESNNLLILRIFGEEQQINIHTYITNLNEEEEFSFLEYTKNDINSTFENLILNHQNFILITELDTLENTIKGAFDFKIENSAGDTMSITNGMFNSSYHEF